MTPLVFALVFLSAAIHVGWNALGKRSEDKVGFALATLLVSTALMIPLFVARRLLVPGPWTGTSLVCVAFSGLFEALYFTLLFSAYHHVDLSVAYPLSRGVAPLFALLAGGLLLGDWLTVPEGTAVAVVLAGVAAVSLSAFHRDASDKVGLGVLFAVATGVMIAGYHVVDRQAMMQAAKPDFYEFLFVKHLWIVLFLVLLVFLRGNGVRRRVLGEWRRAPGTVVAVGVMTPLAYFLILVALTRGTAAHVSAGRNLGIVLSTLVGKLALGETVRPSRWLGVAAIILGILALVFLGTR
ncbi:MAG: GRP family sugar transporter [Lentisphaeria bacterium]|jgi:drug/metabolite transporter (DMT)-like permease|nr:GRP family sugar transporter [Lentisphaeria bacterium]